MKKDIRIILASQSPRRKELLERLGLKFEIIVSNKEEKIPDNTSITDVPMVLAGIKADDVYQRTSGDRIIIGSDTIVALDGKIYGKPKFDNVARQFLKELSGKTHQVITGLSVIIDIDGKKEVYNSSTVTDVKMIEMTDSMIDYYVSTKEPLDKAGAYAIQGIASIFIDSISGNMDSVIGLPTHKIVEILHNHNLI